MICFLPGWHLAIILFLCVSAHAALITQDIQSTHLRWTLELSKSDLALEKNDQVYELKFLNLTLFEALKEKVTQLPQAVGYIEKIESDKSQYPEKPATLKITLSNKKVEVFSFYREAEKKWMIDFWINPDQAQKVIPKAVTAKNQLPSSAESKKEKGNQNLKLDPNLVKKLSPLSGATLVPEVSHSSQNVGYRDFRYGASFVWNYPPLAPELTKDVVLESKIPDSLYEIKDRENLKDEKEAHLQLSINFYRQQKWGLMNKSINLYESKYGKDSHYELNQWLRINSLFKQNLTQKDQKLQANGMNLLTNLIEGSQNYELKRASYRFLLQYQISRGDYFKGLELAKNFFIESRGQFDYDMVTFSAQVILQCLARLRQDEKIGEFLSDKKLASLLPGQVLESYLGYSYLKGLKTKEVIQIWEQGKKGFVAPIHYSILFNTAEAYFREAEFEKSQALFSAFLKDWAYMKEASAARTRLALMAELTDKGVEETLKLYKESIDRSAQPLPRLESKIRYVAIRLARKIQLTEADKETEIFLEQSQDEAQDITAEHKKILWLTRLRIFINQKKFKEAYAYLMTIPLDSFKVSERRVFEGDGAEIIYGLIDEHYKNANYAEAVKIWEINKNKWEKRIAANPFINFIIADSFLKLGLQKSFDRALNDIKSIQDYEAREFPIWVSYEQARQIQSYIDELKLMQLLSLKDWTAAEAKLASLSGAIRDQLLATYGRGLIHFHQQKWSESIGEFEKIFTLQTKQDHLSPVQMAEVLNSYVEALHATKDTERFRTIIKALVGDILKSKSAPILNVAERVSYLQIETLAEDQKTNWQEVEVLARDFTKRFQKSPYIPRMDYLIALSRIKNGKVEEGRVILKSLTTQKDVPGYVREMARMELSTLELKDKQL